MVDQRWRRVRAWLRERERYFRTTCVVGNDHAVRAEVFKAVLIVMDAETRIQRKRARKGDH